MKIEEAYGVKIVSQHMYPTHEIKVGSIWMDSEGQFVKVLGTDRNAIHYGWGLCSAVKDSFSFQCRYCLVVE
jgi:hypothetical protein